MYYDQKKLNTLPDTSDKNLKAEASAYFNRGLTFQNSDNHQEAIDDFSNAIQIDSI